MKQLFIVLTLSVLIPEILSSQSNDSIPLYNPDLDAAKQINMAVVQAKTENKHVLIQVGGNWCPWCIKIHQFMVDHYKIDSLVKADYVLIHVNYSKENKNPETMARLGYPQRFGFPVFVILDKEGIRIHTQNSIYLEESELYSEERFIDFLTAWNRKAIDPRTYIKK